MDFIHPTEEEKELCQNSIIGKRSNSIKIDYKNKINDKPWEKNI